MSFGNTTETDLLLLLFNNVNAADHGDATGLRGSLGAGSYHLALHTADPGETGVQDTSEVAYTGYARVAVARTSGGFTISGNQVSNAAVVAFPACTGGSATATHFSLGTAASGTGKVVAKGALSSSLAISNGITPQFAIGALVATLD